MPDTEIDEIECNREIPCEQCKYYAHDFHLCSVPFLDDEDIPEIDKEEDHEL